MSTNTATAAREESAAQHGQKDIFSANKLRQCGAALEAMPPRFLDEISDTFCALHEEYEKAAADLPSAKQHIGQMALLSLALKDKLAAIALPFDAQLAGSLHEYTRELAHFSTDTMLIVRKHLDVLAIVLREDTEGDGGALGSEILASLRKLIDISRKFSR